MMNPKIWLMVGIGLQSIGSLGIGMSILLYRWKGFDTMISPWTQLSFVVYMLGYLPVAVGTIMTPLNLFQDARRQHVGYAADDSLR
jgi:hypothetical protein